MKHIAVLEDTYFLFRIKWFLLIFLGENSHNLCAFFSLDFRQKRQNSKNFLECSSIFPIFQQAWSQNSQQIKLLSFQLFLSLPFCSWI